MVKHAPALAANRYDVPLFTMIKNESVAFCASKVRTAPSPSVNGSPDVHTPGDRRAVQCRQEAGGRPGCEVCVHRDEVELLHTHTQKQG